jgi:hypothetical protein
MQEGHAMPMEIHSKDGTVLFIRTVVGNGLTVIETWEEQPAQEQQPIDASGEDES